MITLKNDLLTIQAKTAGAELTSIKTNNNQLEYLWQAGDIWNRYAPVLFPIVGRLEDGQYRLGDKTYELSQHGFARDMEFSIESQSDSKAVFLLQSNEATLAKFPFRFEFRTILELKANTLTVRREVTNIDNQDIYFSVGEHPGFNCPLLPGDSYEDYYIELSEKETIGKFILDSGLLTENTTPFLSNENIIPLKKELFNDDALVFKYLKSDTVSIKSKKHKHAVNMNFKGYPFLGIWTKPGTDSFVCLEPWNGIADTKGKHWDFKNKEGVIKLLPGKQFSCEYKLTIE